MTIHLSRPVSHQPRTRRRLGMLVVLALLALVLPMPTVSAEEVDLEKLEGIDAFPGREAERQTLAKNGFVVLPRFQRQIFSSYIGGSLPYYVTTDSAHHTYHVLFETALKEVEHGVATQVRIFLERLHERLTATPRPPQQASAEGRDLAIAHVAVALRLLGCEADVEPGSAEAVAAEVQFATQAVGTGSSPLFGVLEDYALYEPRGIYAGDATLERYFRAATWLGRRGLRVVDARETWAALHLVRTIGSDETLRLGLARFADFLDWMVGPPDDLTVIEYAAALDGVVGADASERALVARFDEIRAALRGLRGPEVNAQVLPPDDWERFREETKGLRLLPSRLTPDAWLFQTLVEQAPLSGLPSGLEVAQALGSKRAGAHRAGEGEHGQRRAALVRDATPAFDRRLEGTHYGATLRAAALLFDPSSPLGRGTDTQAGAEGTPVFPGTLFRSDPWRDRLLATGLSTWTSLRHAWALHAKITLYFLGLTRDPAGVVEPAPRFYAALAGLARTLVERTDLLGGLGGDPREALAQVLPVLETIATVDMTLEDMERVQAGLQILELHGEALERLLAVTGRDESRVALAEIAPRLRAWLEGTGALDAEEQAWVDGLAVSDTRAKLLLFAGLMDDLERIAETEIRGEAITAADEELIREYGKTIAGLNFFGGNSWLSPDKQMGLVATFATDPRRGTYRESAVGAAMELYVALPIRGGGRRLYRGGVYAWYEFSSSRPTTDAQWVEQVTKRQTPPLPAWTSSYVAAPEPEEVVARIRAGEIVEELEDLSAPAIGAALLEQLETGTHETTEQDAHLAWVAMALVRYRASDLEPRIAEALGRWLIRARDEVRGARTDPVTARLGEAVAVALSSFLGEADPPRLLDLVRNPPPGAPKSLPERVVIALELTRDPAVAREADALVRDENPALRRVGLEIRRRMRCRGVGTRADVLEATLAYLSRTTDDEQRRQALLELDISLDEYAEFLRPEHLQVITPLLASEDSRVVGGALGVWGHAIGTLPPGDAYVAESVAWLVKRFPSGPWRVSVGCLDALAGIGTAAALEALAAITVDSEVDVRLRSLAVGRLGECGEGALPHLWPLCFDETESSGSINSHEMHLCDDAAEAIDEILGGRFEWRNSVGCERLRVPALESIRAEARVRGYGP